MVAAIATTKQPTKSAEAKKREAAKKRAATIARKHYVREAVILIAGCRARVTSQSNSAERYDVIIEEGRATKCSCPDHQYRKAYCKHMEAVDYQRSLPVLDQGIAKYRKVRGQAKLIAVPVKVEEVKEMTEVKKGTQPAAKPTTERRTTLLTQPVEVAIIERRDIEDGGVELQCTDSEGTACTVTLRRNKLHSCTCGSRSHCEHVVHCVTVENARWKAEQAKAVVEAKKAVEATVKAEPVEAAAKSMAERVKDAPLNGNRKFSLLR